MTRPARYGALAALLMFVLPACGLLTSSAEEEEGCSIPVIRLTGVEVRPLDRDGNGTFYSSTLRNQIAFSAKAEYDVIERREVECVSGPLVDPAPGITVNPVEFGSRKVIQFDGPIRARGESIPAYTNLLGVEALSEEVGLLGRIGAFGLTTTRFDRDTYDIPDGKYEVTFAWTTSEGETLSDRADVRIDLE